jgi:hypothetical protein
LNEIDSWPLSSTGRADVNLVAVIECVAVIALFTITAVYLARARSFAPVLAVILSACLVATIAVVPAGFLMESALALAFVVGAMTAIEGGRSVLAGALFAAAGATRLEFFAAAGLAFVLSLRGRERLRFAAGFLPTCGAELGCLLYSYGDVIPNTVRAKGTVYALDVESFLFYAAPRPLNENPSRWFSAGWYAALLLSTALTCLAVWRTRTDAAARDDRRTSGVLAAFALLLTAIWAARKTMMFPWYPCLALFPLALAVVAARPLIRRRVFPALALGGVVVVGPVAAESAAAIFAAARSSPTGSIRTFENSRTRTYLSLGEQLFRMHPRSVLMTSEIGALGWTFQGKILDGLGLVSPEVLRYHHPEPGPASASIPVQAIVDLKPGLVVNMDQFLVEFLRASQDGALTGYSYRSGVPVIQDGGNSYGLWVSDGVLVFERDVGGQVSGALPAVTAKNTSSRSCEP